jgi:hypothetical protein
MTLAPEAVQRMLECIALPLDLYLCLSAEHLYKGSVWCYLCALLSSDIQRHPLQCPNLQRVFLVILSGVQVNLCSRTIASSSHYEYPH